ncbi:MAG: hypothetical protein MUF72_01255 [Elainella sp. Prado103]|nr:hypothetical protein [Elainella sp. Prado103]
MPHSASPLSQTLQISRSDRWLIHQRLTELDIPCRCLSNGDLQIEIVNPIVLIQLRSVLQQFVVPRSQLVCWLEQCWQKS